MKSPLFIFDDREQYVLAEKGKLKIMIVIDKNAWKQNITLIEILIPEQSGLEHDLYSLQTLELKESEGWIYVSFEWFEHFKELLKILQDRGWKINQKILEQLESYSLERL